ncbi:hypothetical protein ABZ353_25015 [Streptomyces niveus]|uniref:hypothetical protein n=1 Tax=Streptomyces niveus TaxID=193462 RepID=UPI0033CFECC6
MPDIDENRRTPEELAMLGDIEPDMREVIVEGRTDVALMQWFFSRAVPESDVQLFAVQDRVLIPDDTVKSRGQNTGARGLVITTATIVHENSPESDRIIFVADRDCYSIGLDSCPEIGNLLYTDYTSMESYYFSPKVLGKMLSVALRAPKEIVAEKLVSEITPVLIDLFLIRATLRSLPEPKKLAGKVIDRLKFSSDGHALDIVDALLRSCPGSSKEDLMAIFSALEVSPESDVRHYIRGHDISAVVIKYVASMHARLFREDRRHLSQPDAMSICLVTCLELVDLENFGLFRALKTYASRKPAPPE